VRTCLHAAAAAEITKLFLFSSNATAASEDMPKSD
jgi:hypothetical protein